MIFYARASFSLYPIFTACKMTKEYNCDFIFTSKTTTNWMCPNIKSWAGVFPSGGYPSESGRQEASQSPCSPYPVEQGEQVSWWWWLFWRWCSATGNSLLLLLQSSAHNRTCNDGNDDDEEEEEDDDDEEEEEDVQDDGDHLSAGSRLLCVHHKLRRTQLLHLHLCNLDHCSTFPFWGYHHRERQRNQFTWLLCESVHIIISAQCAFTPDFWPILLASFCSVAYRVHISSHRFQPGSA